MLIRPAKRTRIFLVAAVAFAASGCATPVKYAEGPMTRYDKNTDFQVVDRADGFTVNTRYARYQFVPESDAVSVACRQQATAIAWEHARKAGRSIKPINDQEVRISMGRNGVSGITSCTASVPAYYAD